MANFEAIAKTLPREAPGCVTLQPTVWVSDWEDKPRDTVVLGLRLLGARDKANVLKQAREHVANSAESDNAFEALQLAKIRFLVAMAVCDPNDATKAPAVLPYPLEQVFQYLTEGGVRYVFDAWHKLEIEKSPSWPEADGDELTELVELLGSGAIDDLEEADRSAVLRHLRFALELLRAE